MRHRTLVAGLVTVVVLLAAVASVAAIGWFGSDDGDDAPVISTDMHTADGATVGRAELLDTHPVTVDVDLTGWAEMLVDYDLPDDQQWSLTVGIEGRQTTFPLTSDSWTAQLTVLGADLGDVRSIALVDDTGRIWCAGNFPD